MNKKGVSVLLMVFEIAAALFVIFIMTSVARDLSSETFTERVRTASDLSLLTHALIAAPGDIIAYYPGDLSQYTLSADTTTLRVSQQQEGLAVLSVKKDYVPLSNNILSGKVENQKLVHFKKQGQKISFSAETAILETYINIPESNTKDPDWPSRKIAIIPKAIDGKINAVGEAITITINQKSGKDTAKLMEARDITEADMIIEIKRINEKGKAGALISSNEAFLRQNRKLASLILSKIEGVTSTNIILTQQYTLSRGNIAIIVEIDQANTFDEAVIQAIPEAIEEYYE